MEDPYLISLTWVIRVIESMSGVIDELGEGLIFIISLPRSGSTLLQRILGSHPAVVTRSETWLMLPLLYPMLKGTYDVEYDANLGGKALSDFINDLPQSWHDYVVGVRRMAAYLYTKALCGTDGRRYLDKTPRYYLIYDALRRVFPRAHYIMLLRHPLAVLHSMGRDRVWSRWRDLEDYAIDIRVGARKLASAVEASEETACVVRYEELVRTPDRVVAEICRNLGLEFEPDMVRYGGRAVERWSFGDQERIYRHREPRAEYADAWIDSLGEPQFARIAQEFVVMIGEETFRRLGYSSSLLEDVVVDVGRGRRPTISLASAIGEATGGEGGKSGHKLRAVRRRAEWLLYRVMRRWSGDR